MLSKNEIARAIEARTGVKPALVKNVLDALAAVAAEEVSGGEDFTVPGVARISYSYRKPAGKGERWHKGDEVSGPAGPSIKDTDSPVVKAMVKVRAIPAPPIKRIVPKSTDAAAQRKFLGSRAGKAVVARKGR